MKKPMNIIQQGGGPSLLLMLLFIFSSFSLQAQKAPHLFARLSLLKVPPGKHQEFKTFMKETIKPVEVLRRQKGKIVLWILFKVHFTGANDEYNYASVSYYPGWANTEPSLSLPDLLKEVNPAADVPAILAKFREVQTLVRQPLVYQLESVEPNPPRPSKYVRLDYMKTKPGKVNDYLATEKNDWMPIHKTLMNEGRCTGWALWELSFPGGAGADYDFVTSSRYGTYVDVLATDLEETFKKASPNKNMNDIMARTLESRDLVKSELWEVIDMLQ